MKPSKSVAIVGAGLAGLAAALRLAHAGWNVTIFERNPRPGGKMNLLNDQGFRWDTGPSLLTMPYVLHDLWRSVGLRLEDDLQLVRLPSTCRYRWSDGVTIDEDADFWRRPDVARFLHWAKGVHDLSADTFLHSPPDQWLRKLLSPATLLNLRHLPKVALPRTLAQIVTRFFPHDHRLQQIFLRFATYNGSSPWLTPAAFVIIPYVQATYGGWFIKGGMYGLAAALARRAAEAGAHLVTGTEVTSVRPAPNGFRLTLSGPGSPSRDFHANAVLCNQDALTSHTDPNFLPTEFHAPFRRRHIEKQDLSTSGLVLRLGVRAQNPGLQHHNILFSDNYPAEFDQIFNQHRPPEQPTIYIAINNRTDPDAAPPGCENWFLLVNTPPLPDAKSPRPHAPWADLAPTYADHILGLLPRYGIPDPRPDLLHHTAFTPQDFADHYRAHAGTLYGLASHSQMSAFRRPPMRLSRDPDWRNFLFLGGATHPGGGIPLVLLSGQMASRALIANNAP